MASPTSDKIFREPRHEFRIWGSGLEESELPIFGKRLSDEAKASTQGTKRAASEVFASSVVPSEPKRSRLAAPADEDLGFEGSFALAEMDKITKLPPAPWTDTDLLIYPNDFEPLPLNGISVSEFEKMNHLYLEICAGKLLFEIEGSDDFRKHFLENGVKKILSRSVGREVMFKLANCSQKLLIAPITQTNVVTVIPAPTDSPIKLYINPYTPSSTLGKLNGKPILIDQPFDTKLFQGLIHLCNQLDKDEAHRLDKRSTMSDEFILLINQVKVMGIRKPFSLDSKDISYNPINENRYRAAWGLPLRMGFLTNSVQKSDVEKERSEKLKSRSEFEYWHTGSYLMNMALLGQVREMEEILSHDKQIVRSIGENGLPILEDLLIKVVDHDILESFEFLIKLGVRPLHDSITDVPTDQVEFEKELLWNLTYWAAFYGASKILNKLLLSPEVQDKINMGRKSSIMYKLISMNCAPDKINPHIVGLVDLMIKLGADISELNSLNVSLFHWAATHGSVEVMKLLIKAGSKTDEFTKEGDTPLRLALMGCHDEAVQFLLSKGANVNALTETGDRITHSILRDEDAPIIERLLDLPGIDYKALGANGKTLFECLKENTTLNEEDKLFFAKYLVMKGAASVAEDSIPMPIEKEEEKE